MWRNKMVLGGLLLLLAVAARAEAPARVLVVGSYHMAGAARDAVNVDAADVLAPPRQAQIEAVVERLAAFAPTLVAVELGAAQAGSAYPRYLEGQLADSRNEAVQIGFRLARRVGLPRVHGIDVPGAFPMPAVMAYAAETGRMAAIQAAMGPVMARAQALAALSASDIGAALRQVNDRRTLAADHALHMGLLRFGAGERQPGVELMAAWMQRNLAMCARLLQQLRPGDRAFLLVGAGHVEPIRECLRTVPGVEVVDGLAYL